MDTRTAVWVSTQRQLWIKTRPCLCTPPKILDLRNPRPATGTLSWSSPKLLRRLPGSAGEPLRRRLVPSSKETALFLPLPAVPSGAPPKLSKSNLGSASDALRGYGVHLKTSNIGVSKSIAAVSLLRQSCVQIRRNKWSETNTKQHWLVRA